MAIGQVVVIYCWEDLNSDSYFPVCALGLQASGRRNFGLRLVSLPKDAVLMWCNIVNTDRSLVYCQAVYLDCKDYWL